MCTAVTLTQPAAEAWHLRHERSKVVQRQRPHWHHHPHPPHALNLFTGATQTFQLSSKSKRAKTLETKDFTKTAMLNKNMRPNLNKNRRNSSKMASLCFVLKLVFSLRHWKCYILVLDFGRFSVQPIKFRTVFRSEISDLVTEMHAASLQKNFGRNFGRFSFRPFFGFAESRSLVHLHSTVS